MLAALPLRYRDATRWNESNSEAWLKLGKAGEKLSDRKSTKAAYARRLPLAPDAKTAAAIRRKLEALK